MVDEFLLTSVDAFPMLQFYSNGRTISREKTMNFKKQDSYPLFLSS